MLKTAIAIFCLLFFFVAAQAQQATIKGRINDSLEKKTLTNAVISLLRRSDTTLIYFTRSNANGDFSLPKTDTGQYIILVTYPRFADYMEKLDLHAELNLGEIDMTLKSKMLEEVIIRTGAAIRIKGDTTEFVADSFKVKEGATVEDLLKKLPGFTVNSKGEIVAQGKRVDKVLVDGEEFFGDDPTMATQNIGAKAVDRIQVFDTKSEQQQLTGITTGNEGKTVNIKLKEDAKKGAFGKLYAGSDFNKFVDTKALYNKFAGKKKISAYVSKTNVNAGSLSWEEKQKLGIENDFEYDELNGYYFSFGGSDDFSDWSLRGLPDAYTAGALFSNKWNSDKHNVNLSYRFNRLGTTNTGTTLVQNILPGGLSYTNTYSTKKGLIQQHAINAKYEWKPDSMASFKLTSVTTFKTNDVSGNTNSEYLDANKQFVNQSFRGYTSSSSRTQTDNQLVYKQLFKKKNRLFQTTVRYGITKDDNTGINNTRIRYFKNGVFDYSDTTDQQKLFDGRSTTTGIKSTFSEPLSLKWTMVLDYAYNRNHSISLRNTFDKDINDKYEILVPDFSNNFEMDANSHSGNGTFRYAGKKFKFALGSGLSTVKLRLEDLDNKTVNFYNFLNITPQAQINYTVKQQTNLGLSYRGTTRQPTLNQLQPLKDNTDPLNIYKGNPDLKVGFTHNLNLSFNQYKVLSQSGIFMNLGYNLQQKAISQFNTVDSQGKRTYYPVNVNGNHNWYFWGYWNKGGGEKKPHYGLQINGNGGRNINFVNGEKATNDFTTVQLVPSFGFEAPDKYSLEINPNLGYNISRSSLSTSINNNYFTYGGNLSGYVMLPVKLELSSDLNADLRQSIKAFDHATNTNLVVWNAGISRKIFKDKLGKISFYVNDILNDNKGFTRTINNSFITDDRYERVSRYFLLKFEWSFNKMPGGEKK